VVEGFSQIPGLYFNETYAPVMKWEKFPLILAIGALAKCCNPTIQCQIGIPPQYNERRSVGPAT
jgi:hypothetical protein